MPLYVFFIFFITNTMHELGHGLAARLAGLEVISLRIGPFLTILGVKIEGATEGQKSITAAGGPLVDLMMLISLPMFSRFLGTEVAMWLAMVLTVQLLTSIIPYRFKVKESRGGSFLYKTSLFISLKKGVTRHTVRTSGWVASDGQQVFSWLLNPLRQAMCRKTLN